MLIEDLTTIDAFINEKQIQPAQGKREGNILVLGGSPGSGKNWVINNLTDIPNRYKIFDVDAMIEMASKMDAPKFKKSFRSYLERMDDSVLSKELIQHLDQNGVMGFVKDYSSDVYQDTLRGFIHDQQLQRNMKYNFFISSLYGSKPNVALNGTLRNAEYVENDIILLSEVGYSVNKNVDFLFVLNTEGEAINNAAKRGEVSRKIDNTFLINARADMLNNLLSILEGTSDLSKYARHIYVVFNHKDQIEYHSDSDQVKDFEYVKTTLDDTSKVTMLINLIKKTYA